MDNISQNIKQALDMFGPMNPAQIRERLQMRKIHIKESEIKAHCRILLQSQTIRTSTVRGEELFISWGFGN
jgi:hypothetical protein